MLLQLHKSRLVRLLRKIFSNRAQFREVSSYQFALSKTQRGYSNSELSNVVALKTRRFIQAEREEVSVNAVKPIIGLLCLNNLEDKVIVDFGGGAGFHYFLARRFLNRPTSFQWIVVETESMVSAAKELESPELSFTSQLEDIPSLIRGEDKNIDLVIASSVLQYTEDPLTTLRSLINASPNSLYITRTPLSLDRTYVIVQESMLSSNGPGRMPEGFKDSIVKYPATFVKKSEFESVIEEKYVIQLVILEEEQGFNVGGQKIDTYGYFCTRK
jgi:putative methyltransferase (TIGR04325 family)